MHLRRALLLFAIVLGLAAIAASVSRPRDESDQADTVRTPPPATDTEQTPTATPGPGPDGSPPAAQLTFFAVDPTPQRVEAGQAATVLVEVEEPGQVEIPELGISAVAEPLTPARFEVLTRATGRYPITFMPATAEDEQVTAGTLVVAAVEE